MRTAYLTPEELHRRKIERTRKWKSENRERVLAYNHSYYEAHRKDLLEWAHQRRSDRVVIERKWRTKNKSKVAEYSKRSHLKYPERRHANIILNGRKKSLVVPANCAECGIVPPKYLLHAHHPDYRKPLEVIWLCHNCHMEVHRERRIAG